MSYWVSLVDANGDCVTVPHFEGEGGTYVVGGTSNAELNVTYNYSRIWRVRDISGMSGSESEPILVEQVERRGTERDSDYWQPTDGNVGYMCSILLDWARRHPEARWSVS